MASQSYSPYRGESRSFLPQPDAEAYPGSARLITPRQLQCLAWVQEGKSATDIGGILGLSGRTVEGHLIKLCGHLGVKTRVQAVVRARELGLIGQSQP
ncbi:response regulator transcription factor [Phenylobacterium sp.]|uniref:response regulator transcription factor n=1 Tax=Phenylobacterium sp. TaxID=1871053 RepID=UPI0035B32272